MSRSPPLLHSARLQRCSFGAVAGAAWSKPGAVSTDTAAGGIVGYLSVAQLGLLRGPVGAMV